MELVYTGDKSFLRDRDRINVTWRINRLCNFECWYCIEHERDRRLLSYQDALKVVDYLSKIDKKFIRLNITGGEPTLYPRFLNVVAAILDSISPETRLHFNLWTNLSANIQMYQEFYNLCSQYDNVEPGIIPGFHKESMKFEAYEQKWKALKDYGIGKMLFTVYENDCFGDVVKAKDYPHIIRAVKGKEEVMENVDMDFGHFHYYYEPISIFYKDGKYYYSNSLETKDVNKFVCKAYEYNLYIDDDALAYACPRVTRNVKTRPYNLLDNSDVERLLKRDSMVCPLTNCTCEWWIPKFSMGEYNKLKDILDLDYLDSIEEIDREGIDVREGMPT